MTTLTRDAQRAAVRAELAAIEPFDAQEERETVCAALEWLDSGAELCRIEKTATPPRHLVSYFALFDADHVLLVDHRAAELWLPTGGHVEPGEHPQDTVRREIVEELGIEATFLRDAPLFVTATETVGKTAGHVDVSLWYALKGDRHAHLAFDRGEFHSVRWFHAGDVPYDRTDPHLGRFVAKAIRQERRGWQN